MALKDIKSITVQSLIKQFDDFEVLYRGNVRNKIKIPSLNRTGIELASKTIFNKLLTTVLWSTSESKFLDTLKNDQEIMERFKFVLDLCPPVIIITKHFTHTNLLLKVAKNYKTVILRSTYNSSQLYLSVAQWINTQLAKYTLTHGTLINVYGVGVLIQGESGVGKSEVAMELVKKGHLFVADDAVDITSIGGKLHGKPNAISSSFIEVRGIGILNVAKMFGVEKVETSSDVDLVIELKKADTVGTRQSFDRVGNQIKYKTLVGAKVPFYSLPVTPGRKMSELVETAVIDYKLKQEGYSSASEYQRNYRKVIK